MRFSESLAAFLMRQKFGRFSTGDWLQTLSEEDLTALLLWDSGGATVRNRKNLMIL